MAKTGFVLVLALLIVSAVVFFHESKYMKLVLRYQQSLIDQITIREQVLTEKKSLIEHLKSKKCSHSSAQSSSDFKAQQGPSLYVFGGVNESYSPLTSASWRNSVSGEWESIKSMPVARYLSCGAVVDNKIYLFGGWRDSFNYVHDSIVYNIWTNIYTSLPAMPGQRASCAAAYMNGYIYVAGGTKSVYRLNAESDVIRYNIQTQEWSDVSSMMIPRKDHQLVGLDGRLYAVGGSSKRQFMEVYDPRIDQWSFVEGCDLDEDYPGVAVHDGKIYAIGDRFKQYSPDTNQWRYWNKPNDTVEFHKLVSMSGKLWTVGAQVDGSNLKTVYSYEYPNVHWTQEKDMDVARRFYSVFVVNP